MLIVGIDWRFIFPLDCISISPLPIVVAVVVDILNRDRGLGRDAPREIVGLFIDLVFARFLNPSVASFVLRQRFAYWATHWSCSAEQLLSMVTASVKSFAGGVGGS